MKNLVELFKSLCHNLHHGPSMEPFHSAVAAEIDALKAQFEADKPLMDELRAAYKEEVADRERVKRLQEEYDNAPDPAAEPEQLTGEAAPALAEGSEQNPAEPVQTPVTALLGKAQPEPVSAGPDESTPTETNADAIGLNLADTEEVPDAVKDPEQDKVSE